MQKTKNLRRGIKLCITLRLQDGIKTENHCSVAMVFPRSVLHARINCAKELRFFFSLLSRRSSFSSKSIRTDGNICQERLRCAPSSDNFDRKSRNSVAAHFYFSAAILGGTLGKELMAVPWKTSFTIK